tara:strand:+ start:1797 stop:2453 length:657 start_codon:yes stop_codon:yes gene_type:complete
MNLLFLITIIGLICLIISKKTNKLEQVQKSNNKVILIGNSPCVSGYNMGSLIDKFEIVIRFNLSPIQGFETHVGTRTTFRCISDYVVFTKYNQLLNFKNEHLLIAIPFKTQYFDKKQKVVDILKNDFKYSFIPKSCIENINYTRNKWPTSGLICTNYAIMNYNDVTIFGFDYLKPSNKPIHYMKDTHSRQHSKGQHNHEFEKQFFGRLKYSKKITALV